MLIKALYLALVLSTVAIVWVAVAMYLRIKRHLAQPADTRSLPSSASELDEIDRKP